MNQYCSSFKFCFQVYRMKSKPRGLAVIINNKHFTSMWPIRTGSDVDYYNLSSTFKWLGFNIVPYTDLDYEVLQGRNQDLQMRRGGGVPPTPPSPRGMGVVRTGAMQVFG